MGDLARRLAYVTEGCFKYVTHGISERLRVGGRSTGIDREHITWFSFEGEFVVDYPTYLYGHPAQTTIVAMMPSRVLRVTGEQLTKMFCQSIKMMELRAVIGELILSQHRARYIDLHRTTARERYDLLMQRCPGIVEHLDLKDIASFLRSTSGRFALQRTSRPRPSARFAKKSLSARVSHKFLKNA